MTPAHDVLRQADHVLLDFDGPVCAVFGTVTDSEVADALRTALAERGYTLSEELRTATDPFDMLSYATEVGVELATAVEAEFSRWEQRAVLRTQATTGTHDVLVWITESGRSVTIVSNNAVSAVETYLAAAGLDRLIAGISARQPDDIGRLKPNPHLLNRAISTLGTVADRCVMIGDSTSDIDAAAAAGMPAIAYANKPGKYDMLAAHSPHAIITSMAELLPKSSSTGGADRVYQR